MIKLLTAERVTIDKHRIIHIQVWLDTTKTQADGITPDPAYVFDLHYSTTFPEGITTKADFETWLKNDVKTWATNQLQVIANPPSNTISTLQGQTY